MKDFSDLSSSSRQVLDVVWRHGPSSRAQISALTGLTRPAISQIVQDLTERQVLTEQPSRKGQRGQPARPLAVDGARAFSVGVNFSHSYVETAVIDLSGVLISTAKSGIGQSDPETLASAVSRHIDHAIASHSLDRSRLLGVGISMPADLDEQGRWVAHAHFPAMVGADLAERFERLLEAPVILDNDGRVCAIGERVMGVGKGFRTFMLVHLGHGLGGGLIIEGKPYRGAIGNAGIFGQFYPYGHPRPSGLDLLESLNAAGIAVGDFDGLDDLPEAAHPILELWLDRAASQLTLDLFRVSRFFGPEAVILAGRLPWSILSALASRIDFETVRPPRDHLPMAPVLASSLQTLAGAVGAAALPIYRILLP